MIYSTFDKHTNGYLYRKSNKAPQVYLSAAFLNAPFVAWEDVYVETPDDSVADGRGEDARGILTHPKEIEKSHAQSSLTVFGQNLEFWGLALWIGRMAWQAMFGKG
jgi:hypothetical protein